MIGVLKSRDFFVLFCTVMLLSFSQTDGQQADTKFKTIDFDELSTNLDNLTVVDVRRRDELVDFGQIPGSHVLPLQELEESLSLSEGEFLAKYGFPKLRKDDRNLILTCRSGRRIQTANTILVAHGYTNQRLYLGSYLDWVKNNGTLIKPGKPFEPVTLAFTEPTPITSSTESGTDNSTIPKEFIIF